MSESSSVTRREEPETPMETPSARILLCVTAESSMRRVIKVLLWIAVVALPGGVFLLPFALGVHAMPRRNALDVGRDESADAG